VRKVELRDENEINQFLLEYNHQIFHTPAFKNFIEQAFDVKYCFYGMREEGKLALVLPLVKIKSKLFGNKLISSAYIEYGGFVGEKKHVASLIEKLTSKYQSSNNYLEIRGGFNEEFCAGMVKADLYKRFVLHLGDKESVWRGIQKSKRKAIKKALQSVIVKEVPFENLEELYSLYSRNMCSFGSPPYSRKYFVSFYDHLVDKGLAKIFGSYYQGKLVSALLGFTYGDRVHILIAVSNPDYKEYRPNDAMHWEFIQWSINNGYKYFDFGRVREESGQFEYKRKWGCELMELPSYFNLWRGKEIPIVDPGKHGLAVKVWSKMPMWLTKLVGMKIRRGLGI
jgi:serine/alanine adding enzyme